MKTLLMVAAALAFAGLLAYIAYDVNRRGRKWDTLADQERALRYTPWDWYSIPFGQDFAGWRVGIYRTGPSGREDVVVEMWGYEHPDLETRSEAEGRAMTKAAEFNAAKDQRND